jgi:hypothetical protein
VFHVFVSDGRVLQPVLRLGQIAKEDIDMGMSVYGASGNEFRNNVWWWRPLWNYVCDVAAPFTTDEDRAGGHSNHGHFVCAFKAQEIASILLRKIESGECAVHAMSRPIDGYLFSPENVLIRDLESGKFGSLTACQATSDYNFSVENVAKFAEFCAASGGFEIW